MDKLSNVLIEILKIIEKKISFRSMTALLVLAGMIILAYFGLKSSFFADYFREANWFTEETDTEERFWPDMELKQGSIVVRPQLVVSYRGNDIFFLNLTGFYEIDSAELKKEPEGTVPRFALKIADGQKESLDCLKEAFWQAILEELGDETADVRIYDIRLAEISYQNRKAGKSRKRYLLKSPGEVRLITQRELSKWASDQYFAMDLYDRELSRYANSDFMGAVKNCVMHIKNEGE